MPSDVHRIHRGVSRKYLQGYFNEHAFRFNHRNDPETLFGVFLRRLFDPQPSVGLPG
jgi:hypothetical protein